MADVDVYTGDAVAIMMADLSDAPRDLVLYYHVLEQGYDCAFGTRFSHGGRAVAQALAASAQAQQRSGHDVRARELLGRPRGRHEGIPVIQPAWGVLVARTSCRAGLP